MKNMIFNNKIKKSQKIKIKIIKNYYSLPDIQFYFKNEK